MKGIAGDAMREVEVKEGEVMVTEVLNFFFWYLIYREKIIRQYIL